MGDDRRQRRLVVDAGTTWLWSHRQKRGRDGVWWDVLTLHRDGVRVRFVFRAGAPDSGRWTTEGGSWYEGCAGDDRGNLLNLREPGVVRALVDEAGRRGLLPGPGDRPVELDGWELFPAVVAATDG
ncbi:hypothetical protein HUT15_24250 [Streptomyces sp. NA03103]|uniref:hypothetical protein n=1 Tax=unclassified Streptomyces TaxID=2593676 RepID=UPI001591DF02|nr:hypothetical protein [Streptomyces sp. NA03103]QKW63375.1 hypothetical protein HUT15_24250 [Streptomyces sp. NA03103]